MRTTTIRPGRGGAWTGSWQVHAVLWVAVLVFFRDILSRTSFFWNDFLYQYYAFRSFAAVSLAGGELPLWNPFTFNGMPFQADIQSAIFYVPNLLLTFFAGGGRLDYWVVEVSIILHFALAASGMFLLVRSLGAGTWAAAFSGLVYCFSGFMVGHLIHQGFIYQAAWFPLIFLTFRRAVTGRSALNAIASGLLLGHALLAGAPQITLYIVLFLFFYFLFELAVRFRGEGARSAAGTIPYAAAPIVLTGLLTAVQLLPTAELAPLSQRAEISYEKAAEGSFDVTQFIMLAVPKYFGANTAQASEYIGPGDYWQYWETNAYLGIAGLALAVAGAVYRRRDPLALFLAATAVFSILYALGSHFPLHKLFHDFVPRFDKFRVPARMVLWFCFAGSILAGFGLHRLIESAGKDRRGFGVLAICIAAGGAALVAAGVTGAFVPSSVADRTAALATASVQSMIAGGFALALAAAIYLAGRGIAGPGVLAAVVLLLQFADHHQFGFEQNNGLVDPDQYYGSVKQFVDYFREEGKKELFRINSRQEAYMIFDRNQGMVDRLQLMEGYTPLGLARFIPPMSSWDRTCDLMNAKYRIFVNERESTMGVAEATSYVPRAFVVHRAFVARSEEEARARISSPDFDFRGEAVFEEPPPVVLAGPARSGSVVTVSSYGLNRIEMTADAAADGYLVLSEVWYPGWKAEVDGVEAPVLRADWCLRAIPVTAGKHRVVMEFSPPTFRAGAWISSVSLVAAVGGIFVARKREKR